MVRNNLLGENSARLAYKIVNKLLYFNNNKKGLRLYIPSSIEGEVFRLTHNKIGYPNYARTYERLINNLYIFRIANKLYKFIRHYP